MILLRCLHLTGHGNVSTLMMSLIRALAPPVLSADADSGAAGAYKIEERGCIAR